MPPCSFCRGPLPAAGGLPGRRAPARYCCLGCLAAGERVPLPTAGTPAGPIDWVAVRVGLAVVVAAQAMAAGLGLNLHDDVSPDTRAAVHGAILAATLVVVGLLGGPLLTAAWRATRAGRLTIEALFLVSLGGAFGASLSAHLSGHGNVYYEVVAVVLVVYTVGKFGTARGRAAAVAAARAWAADLGTARRVGPAGTAVVPAADIRVGDVVEVHPGEAVPIDGVVRTGTGFVAAAAVTGEPFPVVRRPGDRVTAGCQSLDALFQIEATAPGTARDADRLLAAAAAACDAPLSLQAAADRVGAWFLPLVVATAAATFLYWLWVAGPDAAILNALSVLLVACPCAIGLATPVAVWAAVGRLAGRGLVVRSGDAVERLAGADVVLFDKTGTLTDERFTLVDIETAPGLDRAWLLGVVAVVQERSAHPVARPFADLPRDFAPGTEPRVESVRTVPGCGVDAVVETPGGSRHRLLIGRPGWQVEEWRSGGVEESEPKAAWAWVLHSSTPPLLHSSTFVAVWLDGRPAAVAVVRERVRESAAAALAGFRRLGLPVEVLTGDAPGRAEALGLPAARAGLSPQDKADRVRELVAAGRRPLVVGDGINDGPALLAAHAGVALATGTDVAVGAAAATLYGGDLGTLPWAVGASRAAVRAARRTMLLAAGYNVVGMTLAATGNLHPVAAAGLMAGSSLLLVFAAARAGDGHCFDDSEPSLGESPPVATGGRGRSLVHAAAVAVQGPLFALLAGLPVAPFAADSAVLGVAAARWWVRRPALSHPADMAFGMLTAGNFGMLAGWWADAGFAPVGCPHCCCDIGTDSWKMWAGMLLASTVAVLLLGRRPLPWDRHAGAMLTGGNLGMVAGMIAGSRLAGLAPLEIVPAAVAIHWLGMTAGMLAGMFSGTWIAELLLTVIAITRIAGRSNRRPGRTRSRRRPTGRPGPAAAG